MPKYKLSETKACPMDTSNNPGIFCLKYWILSKDKSCPALTPSPKLLASSAHFV